ncbi:MAG: sodium:proton exchanger [Epulopiscium sp. Nele67-Bin005]|nr:MAG: sodium:proton exchanger [Epulopiscium sp. Nele67-Bin005]
MDTILLVTGTMLLVGLVFEKFAKLLKLPSVTGYLVAGLLLGPSVFDVIPEDIIGKFAIISNLALGFIAFSIGSEFKISYFKRVGLTPIVVAILEAVGAMVFVTSVLLLIGTDLTFALVLGAIASATAAASTIMVVKEYNAKGPVTETLLSVVALDDAVCLVTFGFAVAIAEALTSGGSSLIVSLIEPFTEVFLAILLGLFAGYVMKIPIKYSTSDGSQLSIVIGFIAIIVAVSNIFELSGLLTCMAMGAMFGNVYQKSDMVVKISDAITPPLYMLFFVISGSELNLSVIPSVGVVGLIYIVFRVVGKMMGAYFGAKLMNAPETVQKYLGATLIPQEGVAIALALLAESVVPDFASQIRAIVLCSSLIYGIVGPVISKNALKLAGEIK